MAASKKERKKEEEAFLGGPALVAGT